MIDYIKNIYKNIDDNIILDDDQVKAIINDDKYSLIIAGAGAGKTATMAAKVKYLVDIKKIPQEKILVISYTNKAVNELEEIIDSRFGLKKVNISTFHSLGKKLINKYYDDKMTSISEYNQKKLILKYFIVNFENKDLLKEYIDTFNSNNNHYFSKGFVKNYCLFKTFDEYFNNYKLLKYEKSKDNIEEILYKKEEMYCTYENPLTLKGDLVKSVGEAKIANYLLKNNINYEYEKSVLLDGEEIKPDFTIVHNEQEIYIEYYGLLNKYKNKDYRLKKYKENKEKKERLYNKTKSLHIPLDNLNEDNSYLDKLQIELNKCGIKHNKLSIKDLYFKFLDGNKGAELYHFIDKCLSGIKQIKRSDKRDKINKTII